MCIRLNTDWKIQHSKELTWSYVSLTSLLLATYLCHLRGSGAPCEGGCSRGGIATARGEQGLWYVVFSQPEWKASHAPALWPQHATSSHWHGLACGIPQDEGRHVRRCILSRMHVANRGPEPPRFPKPASCWQPAGSDGKFKGDDLWSFTYLSAVTSGKGRGKTINLDHKIVFQVINMRWGTKDTISP